KANDTPTRPIPKFDSVPPNAAASTALPQPPNTSQNVPKTSAASFLVIESSATPTSNQRCGGLLTKDRNRTAALSGGDPRTARRIQSFEEVPRTPTPPIAWRWKVTIESRCPATHPVLSARVQRWCVESRLR